MASRSKSETESDEDRAARLSHADQLAGKVGLAVMGASIIAGAASNQVEPPVVQNLEVSPKIGLAAEHERKSRTERLAQSLQDAAEALGDGLARKQQRQADLDDPLTDGLDAGRRRSQARRTDVQTQKLGDENGAEDLKRTFRKRKF